MSHDNRDPEAHAAWCSRGAAAATDRADEQRGKISDSKWWEVMRRRRLRESVAMWDAKAKRLVRRAAEVLAGTVMAESWGTRLDES